MNTYNVLYDNIAVNKMAYNCALWLNDLHKKNKDFIICPIMQSSFYFAADVFRYLEFQPVVDFAGVSRHDADDLADSFYLYKAPDPTLYSNKSVVLLDVVTYTGETLNTLSKLVKELGATTTYRAVLGKCQFTTTQLSWYGFVFSDDILYGYGIDKGNRYRSLPYICYE